MVRWALIFTTQFEMPVIRIVSEDRVAAWQGCGWTLLVTETAIHDQGIEDTRIEDEKGRR
jgi:hypothetical protein